MNFLELLGFKKAIDETAKVLEFPKPEPVKAAPPPLKSVPAPKPKPEPREYYRVGYIAESGMTTLTMIGEYNTSMTLTMNKPACEAMIKMLRATYPDDEDDIDPDDPDGGLPVPETEKKVA